MLGRREGMAPRDVSIAAAFALPFAVELVVASVVAPPTEAQWARADPILKLLPRSMVIAFVVIMALLAFAVAVRIAPPTRADLRSAVPRAIAGVVVALVVALSLRAIHGASLPRFIPAEESAAPGFALNMAAGLGEEIVFRIGLLSLVYFAISARAPRSIAATIACVIVGLAFALLHAVGPDASPAAWFVTRFLFPGVVMSAAAIVAGPTFVVVAHCTAHVLVPLLFA